MSRCVSCFFFIIISALLCFASLWFVSFVLCNSQYWNEIKPQWLVCLSHCRISNSFDCLLFSELKLIVVNLFVIDVMVDRGWGKARFFDLAFVNVATKIASFFCEFYTQCTQLAHCEFNMLNDHLFTTFRRLFYSSKSQ